MKCGNRADMYWSDVFFFLILVDVGVNRIRYFEGMVLQNLEKKSLRKWYALL